MSRISRRDFIKWGAGGIALLAAGVPLEGKPICFGKGKERFPNHRKDSEIGPQCLYDVSCRLWDIGISGIWKA